MWYTLCCFVYFEGRTLKRRRNITVPCRVKPGVMVASDSCSSRLAFNLYVCDYDFQYLLQGYFQTWFCLCIFPSMELFPDCLFSGRVTLSVVVKIILGYGVVWPHRDIAWPYAQLSTRPEIWESPLVPSCPLHPATPHLMAQQVSLTLACKYFLNQHPPLHAFCHLPLFWSFLALIRPWLLAGPSASTLILFWLTLHFLITALPNTFNTSVIMQDKLWSFLGHLRSSVVLLWSNPQPHFAPEPSSSFRGW